MATKSKEASPFLRLRKSGTKFREDVTKPLGKHALANNTSQSIFSREECYFALFLEKLCFYNVFWAIFCKILLQTLLFNGIIKPLVRHTRLSAGPLARFKVGFIDHNSFLCLCHLSRPLALAVTLW